MQTRWTLQDAKNKFSEVVNAACAGMPQVVTRRGKPEVVILSVASYNRLLRPGASGPSSFERLLLAMPQGQGEEREIEEPRTELKLREVEF